jgi:hypothetical protein
MVSSIAVGYSPTLPAPHFPNSPDPVVIRPEATIPFGNSRTGRDDTSAKKDIRAKAVNNGAIVLENSSLLQPFTL